MSRLGVLLVLQLACVSVAQLPWLNGRQVSVVAPSRLAWNEQPARLDVINGDRVAVGQHSADVFPADVARPWIVGTFVSLTITRNGETRFGLRYLEMTFPLLLSSPQNDVSFTNEINRDRVSARVQFALPGTQWDNATLTCTTSLGWTQSQYISGRYVQMQSADVRCHYSLPWGAVGVIPSDLFSLPGNGLAIDLFVVERNVSLSLDRVSINWPQFDYLPSSSSPTQSAPSFDWEDTAYAQEVVVDLYPRAWFVPAAAAASGSLWFERQASADELLALSYVNGPTTTTAVIDLGDLAPSPGSAAQWPPPASANWRGIELTFAAASGAPDWSKIGLVTGAELHTFFDKGQASNGLYVVRASRNGPRIAASLPRNVSVVASVPCGLRVRIAVTVDLETEGQRLYFPNFISKTRLRVTYVVPGSQPDWSWQPWVPRPTPAPSMPAPTTFTSTRAVGVAQGGPVGWLAQHNRLYALQSGSQSLAHLAVSLPAAMFDVDVVHRLTLSSWGDASLPADANITRVAFSISHAVLRSTIFESGKFSSAAFEWRSVSLVRGNGTVLAVASETRSCAGGSGRAWPAEYCVDRGRGCLSTVTFADWRTSDGKRAQLSASDMLGCDFSVVLEFARVADIGLGPIDDDGSIFGLQANGLSIVTTGGPIAAVLGPPSLTIQYQSLTSEAPPKTVLTWPFVPTPAPTPAPTAANSLRLLSTTWIQGKLTPVTNAVLEERQRFRPSSNSPYERGEVVQLVLPSRLNAPIDQYSIDFNTAKLQRGVYGEAVLMTTATAPPTVVPEEPPRPCAVFTALCLDSAEYVYSRPCQNYQYFQPGSYVSPQMANCTKLKFHGVVMVEARDFPCARQPNRHCAIALRNCERPEIEMSCNSTDSVYDIEGVPLGERVLAAPFTRPPTPAPTSAPTPMPNFVRDFTTPVRTRPAAGTPAPFTPIEFKAIANFSELGDQLPINGDVLGIELELLQQWVCGAPWYPLPNRPPFQKDAATFRAESCAMVVDTEYEWKFASGKTFVDRGACFANQQPWPTGDGQLQSRVFGGPRSPWLAGLKPGDLSVGGTTQVAITSRLLRPRGNDDGAMAVRVRVHFRAALTDDVPRGCSLRTRIDGAGYLRVPAAMLPASGLVSMAVRSSSFARNGGTAVLMSFATTDSNSTGSLLVRMRDGQLELLELRPAATPAPTAAPTGTTAAAANESVVASAIAAPEFVRLFEVPIFPQAMQELSAGRFLPVSLSWSPEHFCLHYGRGVNTGLSYGLCSQSTYQRGQLVAMPPLASMRVGEWAIGGLLPSLPGADSFIGRAVDIDNVLMYKDVTSDGRRTRGWYDSSDPLLTLLATFPALPGGQGCSCGDAPYTNEARASSLAALQLVGVGCDTSNCAVAPRVPVPASVDGSVGRLIGDSDAMQLAVHALRLCNASIDATQLPKLSHVYRVRGNGTLMSASTCRESVQDTRLFVLRASLCGALDADTVDRSKCVAFNDDALRGPRNCPNGGSEATWLSERDVEYMVIVVTPFEAAVASTAEPPRSFTLDLASCAKPRCGSLPSCFPCSHLGAAGAPYRVTVRDASVTRNLAIETRCVGTECDAGYSMRLRVPVQASLTQPLPSPVAGSTMVFQRGNARVTFTPVAVAPAVYVEPDFNGTLGNDNDLFVAKFRLSDGVTLRADAQLEHYCANPLAMRYRIVLWERALPSAVLQTNVTCKLKPDIDKARSDADASSSSLQCRLQAKLNSTNSTACVTAPPTPAPVYEQMLSVQNDKCDRKLYEVTRIRCKAQALPTLDMEYEGRAISVCRPDMELAGVRAAVEADAARAEALQKLVEDALAKNEPAVDCNVPPIPSTVLNCSAAAAQNLTTKGVTDMGLAFFKGALTGDDDARDSAAESLRVSREAARCEAKQREQEARDKVALALAKEDCWNCRTGPGVVVELIPEFGDETLCFVQQRRTTTLMARVTIELDDEVVFSNVTVPLTQLGIGAGANAFRALFVTPDPPVDAVLRRSLSSTNAAVDVDVAEAPADWVPFAGGSARDWANDSCVRVPASLESSGGPRSFAKARAAAWARLSGEAAKKYLAAQQSQFGALAGDATKRFASSVVAKTGSGVPLGVAGVWQHLSEGGAATQRLTQLAFSMRGSLIGGLAPPGKVDESSVTAQIHVDVTSDPVYDTVAIAVQGQLFNVFNNSGEAYTFEVRCRDTNGLLLASWDVLQRVNETFRLESTLYFVADAATRNSSDTFQRYTTSYTIEIRDSTSLFALLPSVNQTELSLYEAEQAKRADEIDARLLPLVYFFGAGPAAALLVFIAGAVLQKLRPVTDDDLYPRHIWVIVLYVALRVVRSLLLTTTAFRIIMTSVLSEPLSTLEQLPVWVDSMSNKSAEITNLANGALNREIERQSDFFTTQQAKCNELLDEITAAARLRRLNIQRLHANEKEGRNIVGMQTQIADYRTEELKMMSASMVEAEQKKGFCWRKWSTDLFDTSLKYEGDFKTNVNAKIRGINVDTELLERKMDDFKKKYEAFADKAEKAYDKSVKVFNQAVSLAKAVDSIDIFDVFPGPGSFKAPDPFGKGPPFEFKGPNIPPASEWMIDLKLPQCPCEPPPPSPPPFVVNNTQAQRNYTQFAPKPEQDQKAKASAVPIPSVSLRSFVSLPVLVDLFGWLPNFGWLQNLLFIIDVLILLYTHVRTIRGVASLVVGHIQDDEIVQDAALGVRLMKACGCACGAALVGLCLRCVDVCEVCLRKHRQILVKVAQVMSRALLGMLLLAGFAVAMYFLSEFASAIITVQALDGLGIIGAIVSPVTSALGSANVKAIENARVINSQTLVSAKNSYDQAIFDLAVLTDDFNLDQERDLALFNDEYCSLFSTLRRYQKLDTTCTNRVQQTLASMSIEPCVHWQEVVPRLYADVDRGAYRLLIMTTIDPFVTALRTLVLDCIWFIAYVVIAVASAFILGTAMYFLLVLVRMIRVRKRVIFASDRALKAKYTTRKGADERRDGDGDGDRLTIVISPDKKTRASVASVHTDDSHPELPGGVTKAGNHSESVMQRLPSTFGPLDDGVDEASASRLSHSQSRRSTRKSRRGAAAAGQSLPFKKKSVRFPPEMESARPMSGTFAPVKPEDAAVLPGNQIKAGDRAETAMQKLPDFSLQQHQSRRSQRKSRRATAPSAPGLFGALPPTLVPGRAAAETMRSPLPPTLVPTAPPPSSDIYQSVSAVGVVNRFQPGGGAATTPARLPPPPPPTE
jgi:hypothetical protein